MPREKLKPLPPIRFSFSACRSRGSANRLEMLLFEISSFNSIARWQSTIEFDYIPAKDFLAICLTKIRDSIKKKSEWEEINIFFFHLLGIYLGAVCSFEKPSGWAENSTRQRNHTVVGFLEWKWRKQNLNFTAISAFDCNVCARESRWGLVCSSIDAKVNKQIKKKSEMESQLIWYRRCWKFWGFFATMKSNKWSRTRWDSIAFAVTA